jgi:hypothetical protein
MGWLGSVALLGFLYLDLRSEVDDLRAVPVVEAAPVAPEPAVVLSGDDGSAARLAELETWRADLEGRLKKAFTIVDGALNSRVSTLPAASRVEPVTVPATTELERCQRVISQYLAGSLLQPSSVGC